MTQFIKAGTTIATLLMMLVATTPASAQEQDTTETQKTHFEEWDADDDGRLSEEEFHRGISTTSYYDAWDANSDGDLTEAEWEDGMEAYLGEYEGFYTEWDEDGDGIIAEEEFNVETFYTLDVNKDKWMDDDEWIRWYNQGPFELHQN